MELENRVKCLLDEIRQTHRYSMSRIYGLYNEVFGLSETPQSCASCLIRKVSQLKIWLDDLQSKGVKIEEEKNDKKKRGRSKKNHE